MAYLRVTFAKWTVDTNSPEAQEAYRKIATDGLRIFRNQPGFIRYRLMVADKQTTVAVAEWESPELGKVGALHYRDWMRTSGVAQYITLETSDGEIVVTS
jgi:hypothetical protein